MELRKITKQDVSELIRFGNQVYPQRKDYYADLIKFIYNESHPGDPSGVIILENGNIKGQNLCIPMTLWLDGKVKNLWWGHDLIVEENLRSESWGVDILLGSQKFFPNRCGTGSGLNSTKMALKLKYKIVGEMRKYICPTSIACLPFLFSNNKKEYPSHSYGFKLIKSISEFKARNFFNPNLIEAGRSAKWVEWRYFSLGFRKYNLYQNESGDWFVVRIISFKGCKIMLVSDFRCSLTDEISFPYLFKAIKKIAIQMHIPFILFGSTHRFTDRILEKNHGKSMGRPRPIIFPKELKEWITPSLVQDRNYCLITLGDCDGEWSWS